MSAEERLGQWLAESEIRDGRRVRLASKPDDFVYRLVDDFLEGAKHEDLSDLDDVAIGLTQVAFGATEVQAQAIARRLALCLSDGYAEVRAVAVLSIASFATVTDQVAYSTILDGLAQAAEDPQGHVREGVARAISTICASGGRRWTDGCFQAFGYLGHDESPFVRRQTAQAIMDSIEGLIPEDQARLIPLLLDLTNDESGEVRAPAVKALLTARNNCPPEYRRSLEATFTRFHAIPPEPRRR